MSNNRESSVQDHNLPLLIETGQLAVVLGDPLVSKNLVLCCITSQEVFQTNHIPGSILVTPKELISGVKPAVGKLPEPARLEALMARLAIQEDSHVIVYDDEGGGWAGRFIWTLDVLGHAHYSYLDGGLVAWKDEGRPLEKSEITNQPGVPRPIHINEEPIASKSAVEASLNDEDSIVWDARGADEYHGSKQTALRNGHIPGAVNLDWLDMMDKGNSLKLLPLAEIQDMLDSRGISRGKSIITHCHTHHRSGLSYLVGKLLGYRIKAYDGSWSEWGNDPDTPIESSAVN